MGCSRVIGAAFFALLLVDLASAARLGKRGGKGGGGEGEGGGGGFRSDSGSE